jgi:hypothetical protein
MVNTGSFRLSLQLSHRRISVKFQIQRCSTSVSLRPQKLSLPALDTLTEISVVERLRAFFVKHAKLQAFFIIEQTARYQ